MMLNKLTFESEGLTVDYVAFNFEQLNENRKADFITYFYKLGFNSYYTDRKSRNVFDESKKILPTNSLLRLYKYRVGNDFRLFGTKKVYNIFKILKIYYEFRL